jgi:hypothetical protein
MNLMNDIDISGLQRRIAPCRPQYYRIGPVTAKSRPASAASALKCRYQAK